MKPLLALIFLIFNDENYSQPTANKILERDDRNPFSKNRIVASSMTIHCQRGSLQHNIAIRRTLCQKRAIAETNHHVGCETN